MHRFQEQQQKDMWECHQWAVQQVGFDPSQPVEQSYPHNTMLRGGMRGAAVGAVGGAIGGNAGEGAAIGAAAGGFASMLRDRAAAEQQQSMYGSSVQMCDRAYGTCLTARGYQVG